MGVAVGYVTHEFAHIETLERVKRWLIQAGIDPNRIEVHTHGVPRIVVAVEAGQYAEVGQVIDAAELGDPDGRPSIWDIARMPHVHTEKPKPSGPAEGASHSEPSPVAWRPPDTPPENSGEPAVERIREAYEGPGD
jgi:hypothetical protein